MGIVKARLAWREVEAKPVKRPGWRSIVDDITRRHGTTYARVIAKGPRRNATLVVRVEIARALRAEGWSSPRIGRLLNRNHTTVLWYLGTLKSVKRRLP
jgi:chromosomal replication initiation ATPase DnaA